MSGIVVVTGAGAGVGRATVEEFARRGYDVAVRHMYGPGPGRPYPR